MTNTDSLAAPLLSSNQRLVTHLRHVDLAVPDLARQTEFFTSTWGLTEVAGDDGVVFLAAEGSPESYIIRLRRDSTKRLDLIALGAASTLDVDLLADRLGRSGVSVISEPGTIDTPGGGYGFRFFDVDGRTVEVSAEVGLREHRTIEANESIPVCLSHVVLNSPDPERTVAFYESQLGFALSDTLFHPRMGDAMWFLRCNRRHHAVAIARGPHVALHHVSFEMRGVEEFLRGTGRLQRAGIRMLWGPGRHLAGNNTFSYWLDPHGNTVEYTTELELLDEDTWHPSRHDFSDPNVSDQWGTANQMNELIAKESFNDVDTSLFVAPPL